ncbi:Rho GTPase activation protein [Phascolomyces articulosus]|uniref:Rho GTPase activation protein n=1 Tax=Phascolomyces articulosus TaxID=60185 RepID=A0AAD5K221_9FUNG|nr:Rho GTPase activation protein [Phascolomyces articulosus]
MAPSSPDSIPFTDDNDNGNDRFARLMRDTRTKMEAKKLELNATMQEKLPEWKLRGAMYSQYARETGIEWSRKGKEAVDRWKKELAERESSSSSSNTMPTLPSRQSNITLGLVFGVPLEQVIPLDGSLPIVVQRCLDYLDINGVNEVGLYRIPGSLTAVNKLRAVFDAGRDVDLKLLEPEPHVVGTLLKMYLRELPEPIIPPNMYPNLNEDNDNNNDNHNDHLNNEAKLDDEKDIDDIMTPQFIASVKQLTKQLPIHHLQLLRRLCRHLKNVADHSDVNRMPTSNLALVFIPTLGIDRILFHCLVDHHRDIFPSPPVPTKPRHFKSKTLPDTEMMMRMPPAKPTRQHIKPSSSSSLHSNFHQQPMMRSMTTTPTSTPPPPPPSRALGVTTKTAALVQQQQQPIQKQSLKPRSKSMSATSSTTQSPAPFIASWKRTTGTRVEALGKQFEAKWNS